MSGGKKEIKIIAQNRRARHDYFVLDTWEAGIELKGTEVKSMRLGKCNLKDCYAQVVNGEMLVYGMHISPYEKGNVFNKEPLRPKKLLLHKREILRLSGRAAEDGVSIIPLSLYFSGSRVKMEIGLCRGKKLYDKREDLARAADRRDMERAFKGGNRYE